MVITTTELPISGFYSQNQFFASPYIPVDIDSVHTLQFAMEIYDSLLVTKKNAQAAYRLAEVQFRVLGDLDRAYYLYQEANQHGNSESLRIDAGLGMINVFISKGDLQGAKTKTDELIKQNNNRSLFRNNQYRKKFGGRNKFKKNYNYKARQKKNFYENKKTANY